METTSLQKLRQYLQSTTKEQFEKDWAEVEALQLESPTVTAYLEDVARSKSHTVMGYTEIAELPLEGPAVDGRLADLARLKSLTTPVAKISSENVDVVFAEGEASTLFLAA